MSIHRKDNRWIVRWRSEGRHRSRSFATKREAIEFERVRQRDAWRDSVATPEGAVSATAAGEGMSFIVAEDIYEDSPAGVELRSQRPIHEGYFRTIREAEAYRRKMPDADALCITVLYDRFPERDLTEAEIAAGEIDEAIGGEIKRLVAERKSR
jgi:hypothetical protein